MIKEAKGDTTQARSALASALLPYNKALFQKDGKYNSDLKVDDADSSSSSEDEGHLRYLGKRPRAADDFSDQIMNLKQAGQKRAKLNWEQKREKDKSDRQDLRVNLN